MMLNFYYHIRRKLIGMVAAKYQRENMTRTNLLIITAMFGVFFLIGKQSNQQEITELKLKLEVSE